jgi:hypothetical protein
MTDILMPALSPTMEEGVLAKWHVKVGDTVKAGDVIAEIETDKATMEVEAVDEGQITDILVAEGSEAARPLRRRRLLLRWMHRRLKPRRPLRRLPPLRKPRLSPPRPMAPASSPRPWRAASPRRTAWT